MITIVTPATNTKLTTVERARALLGFAVGDVTVGTLIDQASQAIVDHCRRPFALETLRETIEEPMRNGGVLLGRSPVTAITEVKDGADLIPSASYRHDRETGTLFRVAEDGWRVCWQACVTVTYSAGYVLPSDVNGAPAPTLPASVERAAIRLVGAYLSMNERDAMIKSETVEGVGSTTWWVPGGRAGLADPEAQQLLDEYRRFF